MEIEFSNDIESLSKKASGIIYEELIKKPEMLLCTASGSSPLITYKFLGEKYKENPSQFRKLRILKLDEWGGIAMNNPQSCEVYLQKNIIQPLHVSADRYKEIINEFLSGKITTRLPASFLWLHPNVYCLVDKNAVKH